MFMGMLLIDLSFQVSIFSIYLFVYFKWTVLSLCLLVLEQANAERVNVMEWRGFMTTCSVYRTTIKCELQNQNNLILYSTLEVQLLKTLVILCKFSPALISSCPIKSTQQDVLFLFFIFFRKPCFWCWCSHFSGPEWSWNEFASKLSSGNVNDRCLLGILNM